MLLIWLKKNHLQEDEDCVETHEEGKESKKYDLQSERKALLTIPPLNPPEKNITLITLAPTAQKTFILFLTVVLSSHITTPKYHKTSLEFYMHAFSLRHLRIMSDCSDALQYPLLTLIVFPPGHNAFSGHFKHLTTCYLS